MISHDEDLRCAKEWLSAALQGCACWLDQKFDLWCRNVALYPFVESFQVDAVFRLCQLFSVILALYLQIFTNFDSGKVSIVGNFNYGNLECSKHASPLFHKIPSDDHTLYMWPNWHDNTRELQNVFNLTGSNGRTISSVILYFSLNGCFFFKSRKAAKSSGESEGTLVTIPVPANTGEKWHKHATDNGPTRDNQELLFTKSHAFVLFYSQHWKRVDFLVAGQWCFKAHSHDILRWERQSHRWKWTKRRLKTRTGRQNRATIVARNQNRVKHWNESHLPSQL